MNAYQHAIDTKRIDLNDNGLLAWAKHNMPAIMGTLEACAKIQDINNQGTTNMSVELDSSIVPPTHEFKVQQEWENAKVKHYKGTIVPPIHELEVDPVPEGFKQWQDQSIQLAREISDE